MKYKAVILFLLLLGCYCFLFPTANTNTDTADTLVLKNKAFVSDDLVKMKDVALMNAADRGRFGNLVIGVAPDMGKSSTIQKQEIYEKLVGNGFQNPQLKGAPSVTVRRQGSLIDPAFFKEKIHEYIVTNSRWKEGVQVDIVTSKPITVPESGFHWQLTPANGQDFFGNILFKVRAISDSSNEEIYSNWIVAKLKIIQPVAISNRTIQKNETLNGSDIRWEEREITAFCKDAVLDRQGIVGQRAGRMIQPNSVITESLLEKRLLVRRGGTAMLVAQFKGIKATSSVQVLSNGSYGDIVRCVNTQSKIIISAVVTGENTLEVTVQ
jgi:flagella basal body P-ring formation protein FlgA